MVSVFHYGCKDSKNALYLHTFPIKSLEKVAYFHIFSLLLPQNNPQTDNIMNLGTPEIILIALVVLLLFGGKKIPELMKGLGKGVKSFKDGVKGLDDEVKEATEYNKAESK